MNGLEPFKIVGQLIGLQRNDAGEIIGESVIGEVVIYRPNFGCVDKLVDEAIEKQSSGEAIEKPSRQERESLNAG